MFERREDDGPFEQAAKREQARILARAIAALSERQKRVLVLIYVDELSFCEAGSVLEVSKTAVWKTHQRALDILAAQLAKMGITKLR